MDCRDARDMADAFLAAELLGNASDQILRHLETCRFCRDDLGARRALRDGMRRACHRARELAPARLPRLCGPRSRTPARRRSPQPALSGCGCWPQRCSWRSLLPDVSRRDDGLRGCAAAVGDHRNCALERRLKEASIPLEKRARYGGDVSNPVPPDEVTTMAGTARIIRRHVRLRGPAIRACRAQYRGTLVSLF